MNIHIWSDIVCPWCYLGKRRFEHALALFEHRHDVQVTHRSFQLDPSRPRHETTNRRAMLKTKYRLTDDKVREMDARMERLAEIEGLEYHLTDAGLTGNTLDAHQLLQLGKERGVQDAVIERLYRAYFTEQRSVFDRHSLVGLAGEAGLDEAEARDVLDRDAYVDAVAIDVREARTLGVNGVPFFVIGTLRRVGGASHRGLQRRARARLGRARYNVLSLTFLNFTVPAPYCSAIGPRAYFLSSMSTIFIPLTSTISFVPRAVMSMVFHFPPVFTIAIGLATSTIPPVR